MKFKKPSYFKQPKHGMCGAAAIAMVLKTPKKPPNIKKIWKHIQRPDGRGGLDSKANLVASYLLKKNYKATVLKAIDPIGVLIDVYSKGINAILTIQFKEDPNLGHFVVFAGIDEKYVYIHDPFFGPDIKYIHSELIKVWEPMGAVTGNVMILVSKSDEQVVTHCPACKKEFPKSILCPNCQTPYELHHCEIKGCPFEACDNHLWYGVACPHCDFGHKFNKLVDQ